MLRRRLKRLYWAYRGARNWRTRVIYVTNAATSYAAGRLAQLKEGRFALWVYRHSDGVLHPRPLHLAWDGLTLPADHPFWRTHYPPNGWGCRCYVVGARSAAGAQRLGGDPGKPIDPAWEQTDAGSGEPVGIDRGWGYMPGATADIVRQIERKMARLPQPLARALARDIGVDAPQPLGERLRRVGEQRGSVPGGLYEDGATGERWYVKFYADPQQGRSESAALALYRRLGIATPDTAMVTIGGRPALASRWIDGLRAASADQLAAHPDLPRLWQGAILAKDWDVVGLSLDNVFIDAGGRLVKLDAGGAFRFRAQGADKVYDGAIDEVRTLRDAAKNRAAASVFNARFAADVFAEADGIEAVRALKRAQVRKAFEDAGFDAADVQELTATLWRRRDALMRRYDEADLDRVPGARALRDRMRAWGTSAMRGEDVKRDLLPRFEQLLSDELGAWAPQSARIMIGSRTNGWVHSSSAPAAAVMKQWAASRFGAAISYHGGVAGAEQRIADDVARTLSRSGRSLDDIDRLFDAEYAFHQYYLRRLHGWEELSLRRGMERAEFEALYANGRFTPNAVASFSLGAGFGRLYRVEAKVPQTRVLKAYWQGSGYLLPEELEYIVIGGTYRARRIGRR